MGSYIRKTKKKTERADTNWTETEDKILLDNYETLRATGVSKLVNRTPRAVQARLYHLKLKNNEKVRKISVIYPKWTTEEDQILRDNYPVKGALWCSKKLNRTRKACVARARVLNLQRSYRWKKEDDEILRKYYPKYGVKKVSEMLGRTRETCSTRAYVLGIKYINTSLWSKEEIDFIKEFYPKEGVSYVAKTLNRSETAIKVKASVLGLKRPKIWSKEERDFLYKHYPTKGAVWCFKRLNRTKEACRSFALKHNIKYINLNLWTEEEKEVLKKYYPTLGKYVKELLPNKNMNACTQAANKMGLTYQKKDSSSVLKIKKILEQEKVIYRQEVSCNACVDKKPLLFDFAIYKDEKMNDLYGFIEYDGSQHFYKTNVYRNYKISAEAVLERTQRHDKIKNEFCRKYNIPMLRIKYTEENIEELVLNFLKNPENYIKWYSTSLTYLEYYNNFSKEQIQRKYTSFIKWQNQKRSIPKNFVFSISKWREEDDLFLRKYYPEKGAVWCSKYLHRTKEVCMHRASCLGLYKKGHWYPKEDAFLLKHYGKKENAWIAKQLGRSRASILHRANRIGCEKIVKIWNEQEDAYLLKCYRKKPVKEIATFLHRTEHSVLNRIRTLKRTKADLCYQADSNTLNVTTVFPLWPYLLMQKKKGAFVKRWNTSYRGNLFLHIQKRRMGNKEKEDYKEQLKTLKKKDFKYGCIVAEAKLVNCVLIDESFLKEKQKQDVYGVLKEGYYVWYFEEVKKVEKPILASGNTGIWAYELKNIDFCK